MYSWMDDISDWNNPSAYAYDASRKAAREAEARKASVHGPRTYSKRARPDLEIVTPKKRIATDSKNPLIIAVDVTGSMQTWPAEIFDRLPLLYTTLSQYRDDLEVSFAAIGDAAVDKWPLQVTDFARGYSLERRLAALFGEGGGGDAPESYGLFAYWVNAHVSVPHSERPFLIVFGDIGMHEKIPAGQIRHFVDDDAAQDLDSIQEWNTVARNWNTWFLRRPGGTRGDETDIQWGKAIGAQQVIQMDDEQRAVDYAMGLIARSWGFFGDFKSNMSARQDPKKIAELERRLDEVKPRLLVCPSCKAPIPVDARGRFTCAFCSSTLEL